ncbi:MAG: class I SAM-dependent methyltransferase [Reichenbachiella sp.]|uniref:class I SAM-dependent methyltransferase n=1 Tax=Reichenbachiella sp. TaxID=2184521 RepID=UPI0032969858
MIPKNEQAQFRAVLFRHLDGIGTAPTAYALHEKGVLSYLTKNQSSTLHELANHFNANEGYLNVALRILCSQGWLNQSVDNEKDVVSFTTNEKSPIAFQWIPLYQDVVELLKLTEKFHPRKFELEPFLVLEKIFKNYCGRYGLQASSNQVEQEIQDQILTHIEGIILGPTIVHLGMSGMFHKYFMEASFKAEEFHNDPDSFKKLLDMFAHAGWFVEKNGTYQFTEKGLFYAKRASAYGVTVSYIPTFRHLDELIFGNLNILKSGDGEDEKHVDRAMNVWGSGGAHAAYFKVVDEIIIDIFNQPIADQPKGILDMGCGNGAFLQHLFDVIEHQTERGKQLDEYPLTLVGVDYNEAALKITKANLVQADIWAKVIWGDIGRPDLLAEDLKGNYGVELKELLNVRTFLDHNRIWQEPQNTKSIISQSKGAFAFEGKRKNNNLVQASLVEHFQKWAPYVKRFGLLLIELHTVDPEMVAQNIGKTAVTAYDATHGYSDQYILEVDEFIKSLELAGLYPDRDQFRKFPNSDLASVTVNLFKEQKA